MPDNDKKLENLQKALGGPLGGDPLSGLKPNLDGFTQDNQDKDLKKKLSASNFSGSNASKKSFKDHKGVNKQVLKGNSKAKKN
jgi:hypothetical protein